jgi:NADH:ubiquinone oxidoreductase subunit D
VDYDLRKYEPYAAYDKVSEVPVGKNGTFDRYWIRIEMKEALRSSSSVSTSFPPGRHADQPKISLGRRRTGCLRTSSI